MAVNNGDVLRVTAKMSILGNDVQNTYHIRSSSNTPVDDTTAVTEITNRIDNAYGYLADEQAGDFTYDTIEVFNVTQDRPMGEYNWPTRTTGTSVDFSLPFQTSGLVLFPTTTARSQGRKYVGPFVENASDSSASPDATVVTAMLNYALALVAAWLVGDGEFEFGNWSYDKFRFAEWLAPIVREVWRTQRRRAAGVGS